MSHLDDDQVIVEFERRRKRMLLNFAIAMMLIMLSLVLRQMVDSFPDFLGIGSNGWYALAAAQFVAGVVFALIGFLQYRCPVCKEIIRGHDKYYFGVVVNPTHCPHCGARLEGK